MADGRVEYEVRANTDKLDSDLGQANSKVGSVAGGIGKAFVGVAAAVGTAAIAIGAAAIKVGIEWESAFAGVRKTVDMTEEEFSMLEDALLNMSKQIPVTATELASIAEAAGQLGIANENIEEFTRVMADLGVATNMSSEEAATALARLANITQMNQEDFSKLGSAIVALGNNFATTESEITEMTLRLAAAAQNAGFTEAEMLGLSTALSSIGVNAQAGGGAMSRVLNMISIAAAEGGDAVSGFAEIAGMSADEFSQKWSEDPAAAFQMFIEGLGRVEAEGGNVAATLQELGISETIATQALMGLANAGDLLGSAFDVANGAWADNTALTAEAAERYKTMESQLTILGNQLTSMGIAIYQGIQEPMGEALVGITDFFNTIQNDGTLDMLIETIGMLGATLADTLLAMLPILLELIATLLPPLLELIETILPPLTDLINMLVPILAQIMESILPVLISLFEMLLPPLIELVGALLPPLVAIFNALLEPLLMLVELLLPPLATLLEALMPIIQALTPIIEFLANLFSGVLGGAIQAVMGVIGFFVDILADVISFITNVFQGNWSAAWDSVVSIFTKIFDGIKAVVAGVINTVISIINGIIRGINMITGAIGINPIKEIEKVSFHSGGIASFKNAKREGSALLKDGEMILTEQQQATLFAMANGSVTPTAPSGAAFQIQNIMEGTLVVDGQILGKVVWQNMDDVMAYN